MIPIYEKKVSNTEKEKKARPVIKTISEIISKIEKIPLHFSNEESMMFHIGYHHQRSNGIEKAKQAKQLKQEQEIAEEA